MKRKLVFLALIACFIARLPEAAKRPCGEQYVAPDPVIIDPVTVGQA